MTTGHTPGPWHWQRGERFWALYAGQAGKPDALTRILRADQQAGNKIIPINPANARLIAQAPTMYKELQSLSDDLTSWSVGKGGYILAEKVRRRMEKTRAILRAVEGEK